MVRKRRAICKVGVIDLGREEVDRTLCAPSIFAHYRESSVRTVGIECVSSAAQGTCAQGE